MNIIKVPYTMTSANESTASATVSVLWKSPFFDTDYSISVALEVVHEALSGPAAEANYRIGAITNVTPEGFDVYVQTANSVTAGDEVIIHAIAFHD